MQTTTVDACGIRGQGHVVEDDYATVVLDATTRTCGHVAGNRSTDNVKLAAIEDGSAVALAHGCGVAHERRVCQCNVTFTEDAAPTSAGHITRCDVVGQHS